MSIFSKLDEFNTAMMNSLFGPPTVSPAQRRQDEQWRIANEHLDAAVRVLAELQGDIDTPNLSVQEAVLLATAHAQVGILAERLSRR